MASAPVPHSSHEGHSFRLIPEGMAPYRADALDNGNGRDPCWAGRSSGCPFPAFGKSNLFSTSSGCWPFSPLRVAISIAAACRIRPLLSSAVTTFAWPPLCLGLLSFLLYAGLTASYAPPDSALSKLEIPSVYIHEFSAAALVFSLVLPLGLLSLAASLQASRNHVPGIKDILAVLWCLLVPFLCIFLLRSPEGDEKSSSAPLHKQKLPMKKKASRFSFADSLRIMKTPFFR